MVSRKTILGLLPKYNNNSQLLLEDQQVGDIIDRIIWAHKLYATDYDKISSLFWQGDQVRTAEYIFDFEMDNIDYSIEPKKRQSIKSPTRIVTDGTDENEMNDCKHYALFAAGILDSLKRQGYNIDWFYRFANYDLFEVLPQHVFVVLKYDGKEYWIDPVLGEFDYRKPYVNCIDKKVNMSLYSLSGVPGTQSTTIDIPMDKARGAYILMVANNLLKTSSTLSQLIANNKWQIRDFWTNIGGNFSDLQTLVNKSISINTPYTGQYIKLVAIASPILTKMAEFSSYTGDANNAMNVGLDSLTSCAGSGTIGDILQDASSVATDIPGVGNLISSGLKAIDNLFGGGGEDTSMDPLGRINQTNANMISTYNTPGQGLTAMYKDFAATNNAGALNIVISTVDGDTIMCYTGTPPANYESTGTSLSQKFPGANLKDLVNFILTSGYSPTSADMPYWTWLKGIQAGTIPMPTAAAYGISHPLPAGSATAPVALSAVPASPVSASGLIPAAATTTSSITSNTALLIGGAVILGAVLLSNKKSR